MSLKSKKLTWLFKTADQLETIYLAALRIMVLVIATLALIVAIWIAGDGLRSLLTSTKVEAEPVSVSGAEVLKAGREKEAMAAGDAGAQPEIAKDVRERHAAFLKGRFDGYYRLYAQTANAYKKPEDRVLSRDELAARLGYGLSSYASGEDDGVRRFVEDEAYSNQLLGAAKQVVADAGYREKLAKYKAAQKTAKACHLENRSQRGWDTYSTGCAGWWQTPMGCPVIRQVPVEVCEPAYPDNIVSPEQAFASFDQGFRDLWSRKSVSAEETRSAEEARRSSLKATGMPKLTTALTLLGGFLAIMFLFIVIAVERHLRQLKMATKSTEQAN